MKKEHASCHCGKIRLSVEVDGWQPAVDCNCSICQRKGTLLNFFPLEQVQFLTPWQDLPVYKFYKKQISHYFCPVCGVTVFSVADHQGKTTLALNLRTVEGINLEQLSIQKYDGHAI